jgi:DNA-binding XRE family transcriptional regulator
MNKVREVREGIGMSQTELARRTHIGSPNLSAIERGKVVPWPKARRSLARVLRKTIAELFPNGEERVS